jgi:hypothetical protein
MRMFAERVGVPAAHAGVDGPAVADDIDGARSGLLAELTDHVTLSVARAFTATDRPVVPGRNWSGWAASTEATPGRTIEFSGPTGAVMLEAMVLV